MFKVGDKVIYINHEDLSKEYIGMIGVVVGACNPLGNPLIKLVNPKQPYQYKAYRATGEYLKKLTPLEELL